VYWYRKAAEQGNAGAQNNLGDCFYAGRGVAQDYSQAAYWFGKAAEQGDAMAQYNLGSYYFNGHGVAQE
jgi:TPR repeat protein